MTTILHRYLLKELLVLFAIAIAFFSFIFLMTQLLEITNYIVNYGLGLRQVIFLLACNMPYFLQFIIPMAVMIAVLLTFLRMSADREIMALKASGVSVLQLLAPVLFFSLIGAVITATMTIFALPYGRTASTALLNELAATHFDIGLKPRQFIDSFKDVLLYVHQIDPGTRQLKDIFIEDRRSDKTAVTVVAPRGRIIVQPEQRVMVFRLQDGTIHQVDVAGGTANTIRFSTYDIRLDVAKNLEKKSGGTKDEEEMSLSELAAFLQNPHKKDDKYYQALMAWHKKFSLPAASIVLALLGMPLGIVQRASGRSFGIGVGLGFFLLYYLMLSIGSVFGETGDYPPAIGMWVPNAVSLVIAIILLSRAVKEKPLTWPAPFLSLYRCLFSRDQADSRQRRCI